MLVELTIEQAIGFKRVAIAPTEIIGLTEEISVTNSHQCIVTYRYGNDTQRLLVRESYEAVRDLVNAQLANGSSGPASS